MEKPARKSKNLYTEAIAGVTTFFTMAYIVIVNPAILSTEGTGMAFSGVLTATVLICFTMTLLMGLYARLPFAVAPGMGINAFFAFTIILGQKVPWPTALGIVFRAGVLFLLISLTPVRATIARAIPPRRESCGGSSRTSRSIYWPDDAARFILSCTRWRSSPPDCYCLSTQNFRSRARVL